MEKPIHMIIPGIFHPLSRLYQFQYNQHIKKNGPSDNPPHFRLGGQHGEVKNIKILMKDGLEEGGGVRLWNTRTNIVHRVRRKSYLAEKRTIKAFIIQPDQINMAMFFWYIVKSDFSSVGYNANTGQVTFYEVPETHGHV